MNDVTLAWNASAEINGVILGHLTPAMLGAVTPGGGSTVAQHLTHMVQCLQYWAGELDVETANDMPGMESVSADPDLEQLRSVITATYDAVLVMALNAKDTGNLPHATVGKFLMYTVAHDAHHRGQIMLALKTNGYPLPDEAALWSPWNS